MVMVNEWRWDELEEEEEEEEEERDEEKDGLNKKEGFWVKIE